MCMPVIRDITFQSKPLGNSCLYSFFFYTKLKYINILDLGASANRARDSYEGVLISTPSQGLPSLSRSDMLVSFFLMLHFNDNGSVKLEAIHSNDAYTH